MDPHFPSEDPLHPHLPTHSIPSPDQHALYRIPSSQLMTPPTALGQSASLYPAPVMQQRRPSMEQDMYSNSCIPSSLLPPGADPTSVDFRTFYPYVPNEVKHRKRTSRNQLKVLEATFKDETKPNAALRKRLAQQLEMTPRSVQVWFQNRRAKEKTLAGKRTDDKKGKLNPGSPIVEEASPSPVPDIRTPPENLGSPGISEVKVDVGTDVSSPELSSDSSLSLHTAPRLSLHGESTPVPPTLPGGNCNIAPRRPALPDSELQSLRRGSLPTIVYRRLPGGPSDEALGRRRSAVDVSLARLAAHPYAHVAVAANSALYGSQNTSFLRPPSRLAVTPVSAEQRQDAPVFTDPWRPSLHHRASMPHAMNAHGYLAPSQFPRGSDHISPFRRHSSLVPAVSETHAVAHRTSYFDNVPPHALSRSVPPPVSGPLPPPDYSFGQAPHVGGPDYGESTDQLVEGLNAYSFPPPPHEEDDGADDSASTSYDASTGTRFGSFSSVAGSESSVTSACFSEVGSVECVPPCVEYPQGFQPESRRESTASGFLVAFSGLEVGGSSGGSFASPDMQAADASVSPHQRDSSAGTSTYPSPGSTVSPGPSPRLEGETQVIPISTSSELAYALEVKQEETHVISNDMGFVPTNPGPVDEDMKMGLGQNNPYGQAGPSSFESEAPQASSASSSDSSLGSYEFVPRPHKYLVDSNVGLPSMSGHYSPPTYSDADGYTLVSSQSEHYQEHGLGVQQYQPYDGGQYNGPDNYSVSQGYQYSIPECSLTPAELNASYR